MHPLWLLLLFYQYFLLNMYFFWMRSKPRSKFPSPWRCDWKYYFLFVCKNQKSKNNAAFIDIFFLFWVCPFDFFLLHFSESLLFLLEKHFCDVFQWIFRTLIEFEHLFKNYFTILKSFSWLSLILKFWNSCDQFNKFILDFMIVFNQLRNLLFFLQQFYMFCIHDELKHSFSDCSKESILCIKMFE